MKTNRPRNIEKKCFLSLANFVSRTPFNLRKTAKLYKRNTVTITVQRGRKYKLYNGLLGPTKNTSEQKRSNENKSR